jgi:hypothetical protein
VLGGSCACGCHAPTPTYNCQWAWLAAVDTLHGDMQTSVESNRPTGSKGIYWKSLYLCSTMGPSIKVDLAAMKALTKAK